MSNPLLDAALSYALDRKWCVVPLRKRDKRPIFRSWQLVAALHGQSESHIRRWWTAEPDANVGILTGLPSGIVVIDVDPRNGGDDSLIDLLLGTLGAAKRTRLQVRTGSGGLHLYVAHPGIATGRKIASRTGKHGVAAGIELKADGGQQVVAPPSIHPNGTAYTWSTP